MLLHNVVDGQQELDNLSGINLPPPPRSQMARMRQWVQLVELRTVRTQEGEVRSSDFGWEIKMKELCV
jgi:hypothetical protein